MEPVAVIGIGCRFPGAGSPRAFWRLLAGGVDAIREVPAERWSLEEVYDPDPEAPAKTNSRWGGFLDGIDRFDAAFFGISPREARSMDPQQRLLLEVAWEALEDAGQTTGRLAGTPAGVFVGVMGNEYAQAQMADLAGINAYAGGGTSYSMLANRISFHLDLHGPSLTVDTACSSSLVALLLACRSLAAGECTLALAGGVNAMLSPALSIFYTKAGLAARDGRCKSFAAAADGIVRGEGAGVAVLKPFAAALADGDPIRAVVRGGAVNHDGQSNGIMAPSRWSQEAVLRAAYRDAGASPGRVRYVEAHGTGTLLGDPIEAQALGAVLAEGRPQGERCAIGSVKSNFGHLEGAAGIAGFLKAVLALEHRAIPPSLHFDAPNPHIPFDRLPLTVQGSLAPWPADGAPALAGVSSFGLGGTNAHAVLEAAPAPAAGTPRDEPGPHLLALSARSPEGLAERAREIHGFLAAGAEGATLAELCHTAGERRSHHDWRLAVCAGSPAEAAERLAGYLETGTAPGVRSGRRRGRRGKLAFVFSGQGRQWAGMGGELRAREPVFRAALAACDEAIRSAAGWSVLEALDEAFDAAPEASRLARTEVAQPAIFALQVALAALWRSWGIEPDAVVGHSMGEVAAAHVAGVLDLADAARLIVHRGRLMQRAHGHGRMLAVSLPAEDLAAELATELAGGGRLDLAAVNGPALTVVSGETAAVEALAADLAARQVACRLLPGDYAFHGRQMVPLAAELAAELADLAPRAAGPRFVSTRYGRTALGTELDAAYWAGALVEPTRFAAAVAALAALGCDAFVEIGPHPVLGRAVEQSLGGRSAVAVVVPSLRAGEPERATLLGALGALYAGGRDVRWGALFARRPRCVELPPYPWQRRSFWQEPAAGGAAAEAGRPTGHTLLGAGLAVAGARPLRVWDRRIEASQLPYLVDHRIQGAAVLPGTAYLEMARAAAAAARPASSPPPRITAIRFARALAWPEGETRRLQTAIEEPEREDGSGAFRIHSRAEGASVWTLHAEGEIAWDAPVGSAAAAPEPADLAALQARCPQALDVAEHYRRLAARGFGYGPLFQGIERLWRGDGEALAEVRLPAALAGEAGRYGFHPALLDICLQAASVPLAEDAAEGEAFMPTGVAEWRFVGPAAPRLWSHARTRPSLPGGPALVADVRIFDGSGRLVAEVLGIVAERVTGARREDDSRGDGRSDFRDDFRDWLVELDWRPSPLPATRTPPAAGAWLILADRQGIGEALAARWEPAGAALAWPADRFERLGSRRFRFAPGSPGDLRRVLAAAAEEGGPLRGVVDLRALDATEPAPGDDLGAGSAALLAGAAARCGGFAALARELAPAGAGSARLWLVTRGAQPAANVADLALAQAPLWGLGRTLAAELPSHWGGLVDLDPAASPAESAAALAGQLLAQAAGADGEDQVAFRGGVRHVARLAPARAAAGQPAGHPIDGASAWRPDATYLVTGGLGDLGLLVAGWMVERGARHLLLLGRSGLPERRAWRSLPADHPAAARVAAVRALEARGASVHLAVADVAAAGELVPCLDAFAAEGWPAIRGVVHAAGVLGERDLADLDGAAFAEVLRPKVAGGWLLDRCFRGAELDFFVLFSSASALLSSPRLGAYAAANAFLDVLAHRRRAAGEPALSIDWGAWADLGLAGRFTAERGGGRRPVAVIPPEAGLEALGSLLAGGATQVGVLPIDWERWRRSYPTIAAAPLFAGLFAAPATDRERPAASLDRARLLAAAPAARRALAEDYLRAEVARVLELPPAQLDRELPLSAFGFDSLMAVEIRQRVERELGVAVPVVRLIGGAGLAQLAGWLAEEAGAAPSAAVEPVAIEATGAADAAARGAQELLGRLDQLTPEELDGLLGELSSEGVAKHA